MTVLDTAAPTAAPFGEFATKQTLRVGQLVTVDDHRFVGTLFRIATVKQTKAIARPVNPAPGQRGLDFPITMYRLFPGTEADFDPTAHRSHLYRTATAHSAVPVTGIPYVAPLNDGTVVLLNAPFRQFTTRTLMVVTGSRMARGGMRVSLSPLGGSTGAGMSTPQSSVTVVPLAEIGQHL